MPNERHNGTGQAILVLSEEGHKVAKERHRERWSSETRNWKLETGK